MRGGAIPLLAWALLLCLLLAGNWVWTGDAVQVASFAFAVLAVVTFALGFTARDRAAARRGPPSPPARPSPEALPSFSVAPVGIAVGLAAVLFGLAFGHFSIYFGCGLLAASLGRLAVELRAARRSRRRHEEQRP
jgi:membrane protein implicated in regulation of membrane protease activity